MDLLTELAHHIAGQGVEIAEKHGLPLSDPRVMRLIERHSLECRQGLARLLVRVFSAADAELGRNLEALQALDALAENERKNGDGR